MKKVIIGLLITSLLVFALIISFPFLQDKLAVSGHKGWSDVEKAYQWLVASQRTNRIFFVIQPGLLPSQEKMDDCFRPACHGRCGYGVRYKG